MSTKEEISIRILSIKYGTRTRLRQVTTPANLLLPLNRFRTVIQGRSNWVQAPLAHLRSASEVATDPALTMNIDRGSIFLGNCITAFKASSVLTPEELASIFSALLVDCMILGLEHDFSCVRGRGA